ncbi:hypothetical protein ABIC60_002306 [Phyllobacterium ifriqiyense]
MVTRKAIKVSRGGMTKSFRRNIYGIESACNDSQTNVLFLISKADENPRKEKFVITRLINRFRASSSAHRAMLVHFPDSKEAAIRAASTKQSNNLVVAFYTRDSFYEREAQRMSASAIRLGLSVAMTAVDSAGSWVRNASMKAEFLFNERRARRGPLLYVDVDAVFHRDPWPALEEYMGDVAVHYDPRVKKLIAATILINDTPAALILMEMWKDRCNANPDIWDQVVLEQIIAEDAAADAPQFDVRHIPVAFCWIFDRLSNVPVDAVYIEQLQASREARNKPRWFGFVGKRLQRRRDRVEMIDRILMQEKDSDRTKS